MRLAYYLAYYLNTYYLRQKAFSQAVCRIRPMNIIRRASTLQSIRLKSRARRNDTQALIPVRTTGFAVSDIRSVVKSEIVYFQRPAILRYGTDDRHRRTIREVDIDIKSNLHLCAIRIIEMRDYLLDEVVHIFIDPSIVQRLRQEEVRVLRSLRLLRRGRFFRQYSWRGNTFTGERYRSVSRYFLFLRFFCYELL